MSIVPSCQFVRTERTLRTHAKQTR